MIKDWIELCRQSVNERGAFHVALSGGSTPKKIFESLPDDLPWNKVHLYWSDERCVPPDHPDSNYKMAMDTRFSALPIASIHRMEGESEPQEAAKKYNAIMEKVTLDLVMLGMGDDGHTASLFPGTEALNETEKLAVANYVPQKKCWRLTLTFLGIQKARYRRLYALGPAKANMINKIQNLGEDYPAGRVIDCKWFT